MGSGHAVVNITTYLVLNPILLASILIPLQAEACGLFDIKSCFTGGSKVEAIAKYEPSSQNMALLQASISPNQVEAEETEETTIVEETFLMPVAPHNPETKTISDDQISLYVVRGSDTLPEIAKMFGVTVNTLRWANDIKGTTIVPGETLVVLPISGVRHTVRSGDTLQSITKLYKGELEDVLQYNNLPVDSKLIIGDIIIVPDGDSTPISTPIKSPIKVTAPSSGYYSRPLIGGIKTQGIHGRNGVDIAGPHATNILAAAAGEVIISKGAGWNGGYGVYVVIKHSNGTQTLYAHMSATTVEAGASVSKGQVIGKMGNTGKSTGTHVHFEIRGARNPF